MASDPQLRSARLPSQQQVIELLDGEFARAGYEIEDVVIDARARPPRITVIADGDDGLDLELDRRAVPVRIRIAGHRGRFDIRLGVRARGDLTRVWTGRSPRRSTTGGPAAARSR